MFDFNNVIEDNNSKETTDKVFLSMLYCSLISTST